MRKKMQPNLDLHIYPYMPKQTVSDAADSQKVKSSLYAYHPEPIDISTYSNLSLCRCLSKSRDCCQSPEVCNNINFFNEIIINTEYSI